jgi:hypothetical protein
MFKVYAFGCKLTYITNFKMYVTKIIKEQMHKTEIFPFQFQITPRMYVFLLVISKAKL